MNMITRILNPDDDVCMAEIFEHNANWIMTHVREHMAGNCNFRSTKGKFHPMSSHVDAVHAAQLLSEAPDHCTCGNHV